MKSFYTLAWYACLVSIVVLSLGHIAVACTADGELDPTFGVGGTVISDLTGQAYLVALQPDGKILVVGDFSRPPTEYYPVMMRYQADGLLDTTFGTAGTGAVRLDMAGCGALAVQADGKIIVAGSIVVSPYPTPAGGATAAGMPALRAFLDIAVRRYLPDGTPDLAFGQGGRVTTDVKDQNDDSATDVAIQPDGKIVVAGMVETEHDSYDVVVLRYHPDGAVDQSFGAAGIVVTDVGSQFDEAAAVSVQADGKILVAGTTYREATQYDLAVVRYTPDGTLDSTFGPAGTGIVTTDITSAEQGHAMALQPDGKIVVAGTTSANCDFAVVRYTPDGTLDATWGDGGIVTTNFSGSARGFGQSMVLQSDKKIIVAGYIYISTKHADIAIARYTPEGTLDSTFGIDGKVAMNVVEEWDTVYAAALQSDGKLVVVGSAYVGTQFHFIVVRYCGQRPINSEQ